MRPLTRRRAAPPQRPPVIPLIASGGFTNSLLSTPQVQRDDLPLPDSLAFLADALGGGMPAGSRNLLAGVPGGGKTTLALQIGLELGRMGVRSLCVLTEQSAPQLKKRAVELMGDWEADDAQRALMNLQVEAGLLEIGLLPEFLARDVFSPAGAYHGVELIIVDSIQGDGLPAMAFKTYQKVLHFARLCEQNRITTLLLCHVTKAGDMAGPRTLEHGVDMCLVMRRAMLYTLLTVRKNRFRALPPRPVPLKVDPLTSRIVPAPHAEAKPATASTYAGAGSELMEIQAAVAVPADGSRGRTTAPGLPRREIEQLIACISSMDKMDFGELDYRIQCRLPGAGQYQPVFGLPLCMALMASFLRKPIPDHHLYLGEVDLFRSVRPVETDRLLNLRDAIDSGDITLPLRIFVPPPAKETLTQGTDLAVVTCRTLEEAMLQTWPDLR